MENQIGQWKVVLAINRILFIVNLTFVFIWMFFYRFFALYNQNITFIFNSTAIILMPFWFLPFLLRLNRIISKNLKLENCAGLEKTYKKEVITFLIFPLIAGILILVGAKTSLFDRNKALNIIGSFLLFFSIAGYQMLLVFKGIKLLLLRKNIWLRILGIILSFVFVVGFFLFLSR
jgi:hypothetical protein